MTRVRILVVDDEAPARRKVLRHLSGRAEVAEILEAADGLAAVSLIRAEDPDLVFLDIQMPGLNGFEVIEAVGVRNMPQVVFVTAYDEHAIDAFAVEAVDYLLKPYSADRFDQAFHRAIARCEAGGGADPDEGTPLERLQSREMLGGDRLRRLVVGDRQRLVLVPISSITHLNSAGNYVEVHTANKVYLHRITLGDLEERLDPRRFARIHRSTIVNVDFIAELVAESGGSYTVQLTNGAVLRMSRRFRDRLLPG